MIKKIKEIGNECNFRSWTRSIRGSYLVTLEWKGAKSNKRPLGFVEKVFVLILEVFH